MALSVWTRSPIAAVARRTWPQQATNIVRTVSASAPTPAGASSAAALADDVTPDEPVSSSEPTLHTYRDFLRLKLGSHHYDFHWFWLKHNCDHVPISRHPRTGERTVDAADIPLDIQPQRVGWARGSHAGASSIPLLEIAWDANNHHVSHYQVPWLLQHAYGQDHDAVLPPESDVRKVAVRYADYLRPGSARPDPTYFKDVHERLRHYGAAVVLGRGLDTEAIISGFRTKLGVDAWARVGHVSDDLLPKGASVIETHFGRIEDLRTDNTTNKNTDQLGYTDAPVDLHTDQPFIANPPGMQMLQCIRPADKGGDSYLVDARQAALYLRETDPDAFRILTTIPVKFHRRQKAFESIYEGPIIQLDAQGRFQQVRHSYFTLAPHQRPFEQMRAFYRAYNALSTILRDRRNQLFFQLQSGDYVLYDNYRMLHARTGFQGARHVRGVYFNHVDVWRKLNESAGSAPLSRDALADKVGCVDDILIYSGGPHTRSHRGTRRDGPASGLPYN